MTTARIAAALASLCLLAACATTNLPSEGEPLVALMSQRLALSKEIAWAKWANGLPVRDRAREADVLENMVARAEMAGLEPGPIVRFGRAQIEASCREQEMWFVQWKAGKNIPVGDPPDLGSLRAKLDKLAIRLVAEWPLVEGTYIPPAAAAARLVSEGASRPAAAAASSGFLPKKAIPY